MDVDQEASPTQRRISFYVFGDWGDRRASSLASSMASFASKFWAPEFLLVCGDNFYPHGVDRNSKENAKLATTIRVGDSFTTKEFIAWEKTFLKYPCLQVPWKVVLGNHDYEGLGELEIAFTASPLNPRGLWQLRGDEAEAPQRRYTWTRPLWGKHVVQFIAFDSNACQHSVRRIHPEMDDQHAQDVAWLHGVCAKKAGNNEENNNNENVVWRILFMHHPLHTQGKGHQGDSVRLRAAVQVRPDETVQPGLSFEDDVHACGVDIVFAGHEHIMQHHTSVSAQWGSKITHVGCGASLESYYYGGGMKHRCMDWYEKGPVGFVTCQISRTTDTQSTVQIQFVELNSHRVVKSIELTKELSSL